MGLARLRGLIWDIWDKTRTLIIFDRTNMDLMHLQELEEDLYELPSFVGLMGGVWFYGACHPYNMPYQ